MHSVEWPFRAAEALGEELLTFRELRRFHRGIYPGVWVPRGIELSVAELSRAAWLWSGRTAVVAGLSASAILGAKWIDPDTPVELIHTNRRAPRSIIVHTDALLGGETLTARGLPITTPARTVFDIGRRHELRSGVQRIDALMNATQVKVVDVEAVMVRHPGVRGLRRLRETLQFVDGGAESPYESLTRLLLIQAGFPRPATQIEVLDEAGMIFARLDMGWRQWKVGVDFEGAQHWTKPEQFTKDVHRYARLPELGWMDVRVTSGILHKTPEVFLRRVGDALIARGCPRTWPHSW
ncbi:DUF559 domain-containing protein [soil metagenome]